MKYFLAGEAALKWLETPSVYHLKKDELYELDDGAFKFLTSCSSENGCDAEEPEFIDYCMDEGILIKNRSSVRRPQILKSPVPSLRYLELQITDNCNLRCAHCYIGDKTLGELSLEQTTAVLREFEQMQGLRLMITGGEPLLHSNFIALNNMLPDFFFRKALFTNGLLLNKNLLGQLNVDEIQISIDGLEKAHDSLRGEGTFKKAVRALRLAREQGFEVSVATMIHAKNLADFDKMENLFSEIGIKDWTVDVPCITGRLKNNNGFQVPPEVGGKYLRYGYGAGLHAGVPGAGCGPHLLSVMANGMAAKCTFYSDSPLGAIDEGLRVCWERSRPVLLKDLTCDCKYLESCRGGCRYRAELLGDPLGKDLYKCFLHDILKKTD